MESIITLIIGAILGAFFVHFGKLATPVVKDLISSFKHNRNTKK